VKENLARGDSLEDIDVTEIDEGVDRVKQMGLSKKKNKFEKILQKLIQNLII